jgi:hypothetical protein
MEGVYISRGSKVRVRADADLVEIFDVDTLLCPILAIDGLSNDAESALAIDPVCQ